MSDRNSVKMMVVTGLLTGMNVVMSSFSIPVPGGHLYLNDAVICLAAMLLGPFHAFVVGGIGAFIGDMLFYPAPMFVSLATHGLQAVVISLLVANKDVSKGRIILALAIGVVINVFGYSFERAFIYSTPQYAYLKLPFQTFQALFGAVVAPMLLFKCGIKKEFTRIFG